MVAEFLGGDETRSRIPRRASVSCSTARKSAVSITRWLVPHYPGTLSHSVVKEVEHSVVVTHKDLLVAFGENPFRDN